MSEAHYELIISPTARRQLAEVLPESVAFAAYEFIIGPLLTNPHRVGKHLEPPLSDRYSARRGTYRVIYRIDDGMHVVTVVAVVRRADAYRSRHADPSYRRYRGVCDGDGTVNGGEAGARRSEAGGEPESRKGRIRVGGDGVQDAVEAGGQVNQRGPGWRLVPVAG